MTVKEFVDKYNSFNNDTLKEKYIKEIVKDTYVSFTEKQAICNKIVKATMHRTINDGKNEKEIFYSDSANRYLLFQIWLIQSYTDIEFSNEENGMAGIKEFELLDQYGLNDLIISNIPEREMTNFKVILDMKTDDASINENNFISYVDTKLDAIKLFIDTFGDSIMTILNDPKVLEMLQSIQEDNEKGENIVPFKA